MLGYTIKTTKPINKAKQTCKYLTDADRLSGFTLVEMLIIAPIVVLMIGVFISSIVSMTGDVLSTRASNALAYNVQDALNRIESDITLSGGFLSTNNIPLTSPQGYNNDTTNFYNADATTGPMLILNSYATTSNPLLSSQNILYMANQPNACNTTSFNQNPPVMLNIVYFVKNNTLWRRVIEPPNYATAGCINGAADKPWQWPSCAPTTSGTICLAKDERLVDGIQANGFSIKYFPTPNAASYNYNSNATATNKSDNVRLAALQSSSTAVVTIAASGTVSGRDISQSGTIRATSANNNILNNNLVGWWALDGNANDASGNRNSGVIVSAATTTGQDSSVNSAYSLNGTTNYISLPAMKLANSYTISAWIKRDATASGWNTIIGGKSTATNNFAYNSDGRIAFGDFGGSWLAVGGTTALADTASWHNVVAVVNSDGTNATWTLYVDGVSKGTSASMTGDGNFSTPRIGSYADGSGAFFKGLIDDVRIYNSALPLAAVQFIFNSGAQ